MPDTKEMAWCPGDCNLSGLQPLASKKTSHKDKENDQQQKQKKSSKAVKETKKLVAKQTDKTEVPI